MDEDEMLYREMNEEDGFYMGDRKRSNQTRPEYKRTPAKLASYTPRTRTPYWGSPSNKPNDSRKDKGKQGKDPSIWYAMLYIPAAIIITILCIRNCSSDELFPEMGQESNTSVPVQTAAPVVESGATSVHSQEYESPAEIPSTSPLSPDFRTSVPPASVNTSKTVTLPKGYEDGYEDGFEDGSNRDRGASYAPKHNTATYLKDYKKGYSEGYYDGYQDTVEDYAIDHEDDDEDDEYDE